VTANTGLTVYVLLWQWFLWGFFVWLIFLFNLFVQKTLFAWHFAFSFSNINSLCILNILEKLWLIIRVYNYSICNKQVNVISVLPLPRRMGHHTYHDDNKYVHHNAIYGRQKVNRALAVTQVVARTFRYL